MRRSALFTACRSCCTCLNIRWQNLDAAKNMQKFTLGLLTVRCGSGGDAAPGARPAPKIRSCSRKIQKRVVVAVAAQSLFSLLSVSASSPVPQVGLHSGAHLSAPVNSALFFPHIKPISVITPPIYGFFHATLLQEWRSKGLQSPFCGEAFLLRVRPSLLLSFQSRLAKMRNKYINTQSHTQQLNYFYRPLVCPLLTDLLAAHKDIEAEMNAGGWRDSCERNK